MQAILWYSQRRLGEAKSEAMRAVDVYERFGAVEEAKLCRATLQRIEEEMKKPVTPGELDLNGEFLETVLLSTPVNSQFSARDSGHHPTS
jgi:hypothetical protein